MHINANSQEASFTEEKLIEAMKSYNVPVIITELDVNLKDINPKDKQRFLRQAEIYRRIVGAALKSGVCRGIYIFQIGDRYSWLETNEVPNMSSPNADPTPYDDNLAPKLARYAILQAILDFYLNN